MKKPVSPTDASARIDARIEELGDWRGALLARMRALIHAADPEVVEEWKWMGTPVWSHGGILCTGETYKNVVKLTFAKGASLKDPAGLFNSSLEGSPASHRHPGRREGQREGAHGPDSRGGRAQPRHEEQEDQACRLEAVSLLARIL